MSQRPLVFIIIPILSDLSRGRTTKASLCEGGGSAKRWRRERRHAFFLSPSRLRRQPPHRGGLAARQRCHSEPVTVSLAWESVLSFVGKRIAAPVCTPRALASRRGLARNDKVRRGGRLCPPRMTAAPCRAGPMCPAAEHRICPGWAHGPRPTRRQHRFPAQKKKALAGFLFLHLE